LTDLFSVAAVGIAFAVEVAAVMLSLRNVLRQKLTRVFDAKAVLVFAHVFILAIFILEFARVFLYSWPDFMLFYTAGVVSLILWIGILLTSLAYIIYIQPQERTFGERLVALATKRFFPYGLLMLLFIGYILAVDAFLIASQPFSFVTLPDITGLMTPVPLFSKTFILLVLTLFVFFLLFPSLEFVLAIRRISDPITRRAVAVLVAGWDVIALDGLLIYGLLPAIGVNAVGPGQLVAGLVLGITGLSMRRNSILTGMFESAPKPTTKETAPVINGESKGRLLLMGNLKVDSQCQITRGRCSWRPTHR
jgi:hypothetical protein